MRIATRPNPQLGLREYLFVWVITLDLSGMGGSTTSKDNADIALSIMAAQTPPVRQPSVRGRLNLVPSCDRVQNILFRQKDWPRYFSEYPAARNTYVLNTEKATCLATALLQHTNRVLGQEDH
jgi:hypothetical protein